MPPPARPQFSECPNTFELEVDHRVSIEKESFLQQEVQQCLADEKASFNFNSNSQSLPDIEPVVLDKTNINYASFKPFPPLKVDT